MGLPPLLFLTLQTELTYWLTSLQLHHSSNASKVTTVLSLRGSPTTSVPSHSDLLYHLFLIPSFSLNPDYGHYMHIRNTYGKQSLATPWNQCLLLRFYHVQNCQLCSVQRQCTCPHPITSVFGGDLLLYPDDTQNFLTRAPLSLIAKWKIWILRFLMFDLLRCLFIFYYVSLSIVSIVSVAIYILNISK